MASRTPSCWPRSPSPSSHLSPEDVVYLDHDDGCVTLGLAYASFFFVQSYPIFQYLYLKGHISRMGASNGIVFRILNEANSASPHELDPPHLMRLQLLDDPLVDLSSIRHSQGFSFSNQHLDVNRQQDRFNSSSEARCSRQKLIIVGTEASPKRLNDRSKIFKQGSISLSAFDAIVSSTTTDLEVSLLLDKFRTRRFLKLRREA